MENEYQDFVRKPFIVKATKVTLENMDELARHIGDVRHKDDGTPYIFVDKRLVQGVYRVFEGFWVTKLGDTVRCYSEKVFRQQFTELTPVLQEWVDDITSDEFEDDDDKPEVLTEVIQ